MKKISTLLIMLMIFISISSLAIADEPEEDPEEEEFEGETEGENETEDLDNETVKEMEIMNNSLGAEIRLLQLDLNYMKRHLWMSLHLRNGIKHMAEKVVT